MNDLSLLCRMRAHDMVDHAVSRPPMYGEALISLAATVSQMFWGDIFSEFLSMCVTIITPKRVKCWDTPVFFRGGSRAQNIA